MKTLEELFNFCLPVLNVNNIWEEHILWISTSWKIKNPNINEMRKCIATLSASKYISRSSYFRDNGKISDDIISFLSLTFQFYSKYNIPTDKIVLKYGNSIFQSEYDYSIKCTFIPNQKNITRPADESCHSVINDMNIDLPFIVEIISESPEFLGNIISYI